MRATASMLVAAAALAESNEKVACNSACKPWLWAEPGQSAADCSHGSDMLLPFVLGNIDGVAEKLPTTNDLTGGYRTFSFCPAVDKFSSLVLEDSIQYLNSTSWGPFNNMSVSISAYGTGKSFEVRIPEESQDSSVLAWVPSHSKCGGGPAVASFLVYNVTLKDGQYRYKNADPIGNGFVNSCDDDGETCLFDSESFCIGEGRKQNCAVCATGASDPRVLVSFYGTDSSGEALLSGSSNPLNFREFALGNVYSDLKSDIVDEAKNLRNQFDSLT